MNKEYIKRIMNNSWLNEIYVNIFLYVFVFILSNYLEIPKADAVIFSSTAREKFSVREFTESWNVAIMT